MIESDKHKAIKYDISQKTLDRSVKTNEHKVKLNNICSCCG